MAKLKGNLFGNFSGKLGLTYGRMVNGINLGANMPVKRGTKGATSSMKDNWVRFATLGKVASAFLGAARLGLKDKAKQIGPLVTPFDAFVKLNAEAVSAIGGEVEIDFGSLVCAAGNMPQTAFGNASFAEPSRVSVSFQTSAEAPGTDALDKVYVAVYQPDTNQMLLSAPTPRTSGSVDMRLPGAWTGMTVHVYGFTLGDGDENKGDVSDSSYIGTGIIG